jgi:hypothetical protein
MVYGYFTNLITMVFMGFLNQLTTGGLHPVVQFDIPSWISGQRHNSTTVTFSERETIQVRFPIRPRWNYAVFLFGKWSQFLVGSHNISMVIYWRVYRYGSIPIESYRYIFSGMNIHLPAILGFTRGTRFWHTAIWRFHKMGVPQLIHLRRGFSMKRRPSNARLGYDLGLGNRKISIPSFSGSILSSTTMDYQGAKPMIQPS